MVWRMFRKAKFEHLLAPFQIKQVKLPNRMVKTSAAMGLASDDGFVTDANLGFYEAIARGGVGLITVEHGFVDYPVGVTGPRRIAVSHDKFIPGLAKLVKVMHKHGTPCFQQLGHSGPWQKWLLKPGQRPVSSTSVENGARGLSLSEIEELIQKYARAAVRAREAGYDGIEVHAAVGYLINSFLSRAWNKRQDAYGPQDLQSRARFLVEILRAIRQQVGADYPVGIRTNGAEYGIADGLTIQESQSLSKIFAEAGADFISVGVAGYGPYELLFFPEQIQYPEPAVPLAGLVRHPGVVTPLAEAIKGAVSVPVVTVGRIGAALGEWILKTGKADLIGINRSLLADPEYPRKIASGRLEDIAPCTACLECWAAQQRGDHIRCRVNAALGREYAYALKPAARKKNVVVVGGGPAGMEVARLAAMRGHRVVLYEKADRLGGLLPLAALIKGTEIEDLPALAAYLKTQLVKLGVEVRLGTEADAARIEAAGADAVVIASGGTLTVPDIPGIDGRNVVKNVVLHRAARRFLKLFSPQTLRWLTRFYLPAGRSVIIIGGAMQGCELAEFMVKRGRKVTVVEASEQMGNGMHDINRPRLLRWLAKKDVVMMSGVRYKEITGKGLTLITREGEEKTIEAETIMVATPPVPGTAFFEALKGKVKEVYLAGDSRDPKSIVDAISDGAKIGRAV